MCGVVVVSWKVEDEELKAKKPGVTFSVRCEW